MTKPNPQDSVPQAAWLAMGTAIAVIAQQVGGKATRDALFLSSWDAAQLPKVMIAGAAVALVGVLATSAVMPRLGPGRVVPSMFAFSAALYGIEWSLNEIYPAAIAIALFLHMAAFGSICVSGFWSLINERFDPHTAKKVIGRITGGATFGGIIGGVVADRVGAWLDTPSMLLVLSGFNILCACGVFLIALGAKTTRTRTAQPLPGFKILREARYLQHVALLVALLATVAALLDYALKQQAQDSLSGDALISFFAGFYTVTGLLTFIIQTTASKKALEKLGLGGTIAILPLTLLVTGALGAAFTRMWTVVLARGAHAVVNNSLFRSSYELLYTPLSAEKKRPTKTIIDVAFERIGDALGSVIALLVIAVAAAWAVPIALGIAAAGAAAAVLVARTLHRGYVSELAARLRSGAVELDANEVFDATTQRTLSETTMSLDLQKLRAELRKLRPEDPAPSQEPTPTQMAPALRLDPFVQDVSTLVVGDDEQLRRLLNTPNLDLRLAPMVIPLLARQEIGRDALRALRTVAPKVIGQLADALLDEDQPFVVRRRIPRALRVCKDPRAAEALMRGMQDRRFEVRYQCARALSHLQSKNPEFAAPAPDVFAAATRELEVGHKVWQSQRLLDGDLDDDTISVPPSEAPEVEMRFHRSLEHLFNILSLALDRDALALARRALAVDDVGLRGTALEYLENVLPPEIWKGLEPHVGDERMVRPPQRDRKVIVEDLVRTMESMAIDRDMLLKKPSRGGRS